MEDLGDLCDDLSRREEHKTPGGAPNTELYVSSEERNIGHLISELTGSIAQQVTGGVNPSRSTNTGDGVVLTDPTNVDEILTIDEASIPATSHNVTTLNVACQQILQQMEYQLLVLLKKNRKEQEIVQSFLNTNFKSLSFEMNNKRTSLNCTGMPYFKDSYGFQPPPNEDVLRKQKNNKLLPIDFIKTYPVWNNVDAKKLIDAVRQFDVAKPSAIDWLKISVTDMQGKYSASACKAKWLMHLNPSINKSKWNIKEIESLKELSAKYNYQNWDKIATELGTDRSGLQCCIQYHTHTPPTAGKWTKEEDDTLKKLVEKYKVRNYIPWKKVAWHFEDRSLRQCQERYAYHLGNIKRGNFTMEEDFVIVYLASKLKNFGEVAKFLPNRVATQVRARYEYLVEISMPEFSKEEDELLSKLIVQYPRNWEKISGYFKNRSRIQCRRRWGYLQRKIHIDTCSETENDDYLGSLPEVHATGAEKSQIDTENLRKTIPHFSKPTKGEKKYSEAYKKLLDYHKYCHKFLYGPKPRIPSNSEDLRKLTAKMAVTMKNLSVPHSGPVDGFNIDTLSDNCVFDKEDMTILKALNPSEQPPREFELSTRIIPPNYMTLVALRTFTLGWDSIKNLCNCHTEAPCEPSGIDPSDRILCSDAKKLFKTRLKSIFAFPLILSNISTTETHKHVYKPKSRKPGKPLSKRKRKEHAKYMSAAYRNKLKTLSEKFEDPGDVPQENEQVESNPRKGRKPKRTSKLVENSETAGENVGMSASEEKDVNGSRKSAKSQKDSEVKGDVRGTRKRTRSVKAENNECGTPLKKRATRSTSTLNESVTNSEL